MKILRKTICALLAALVLIFSFPAASADSPDTTITLVREELTIRQFRTARIEYSVDLPSGTTRFQSSNEKIAKVNNKGIIEAVGIGKAYIAVINGSATEIVAVTVVAPPVDLENELTNPDGLKYKFNEVADDVFEVKITEYTGSKTSLTVPDTIDGIPVTSIKYNAFSGNKSLKTLKLGNNIRIIGFEAFKDCTVLETIKLPASLREIHGDAFKNCSRLRNVYIEDLHAWNELIFYNIDSLPNRKPVRFFLNGKAMESIELSDVKIRKYFLRNCENLKSAVIGEGCIEIGEAAFENCTGLRTLSLADSIESLCNTFNGCVSLGSVNIPRNLKELRFSEFGGCTSLTEVDYKAVNCKEFGDKLYSAFCGCTSLGTVRIARDVQNIDYYIFNYSSDNITIRGTKGTYAEGFARENNFAFISEGEAETEPETQPEPSSPSSGLPDGLQLVKDTMYTQTYKVRRYIGKDSEVRIPAVYDGSPVTSVLYDAFEDNEYVEKVILPSTITKIDDSAFSGCTNLKEIIIPSSLREIGSAAFYGCKSLEKVTLPEGITEINWDVFANSGVKEVILPKSLTTINGRAFENCKRLKRITIHDGLSTIGKAAFYNCKQLQYIYIDSLSHWCSIDFKSTPLFYADNLVLNGETITDLVIPDDVKTISPSAFLGYKKLRSVSTGSSLEAIPEKCFEGCDRLESVNIGDSVKSIGDNAFLSCINLERVHFGKGLVSVGDDAFVACIKLKKVLIPYNIMSIGLRSFGYYDIGLKIYSLKGTQASNYCIVNNIPWFPASEYTESLDLPEDDSYVLSDYSFVYSGKAIKPTVRVTGLKHKTDFLVSYSANKNAGTATVTVKGTGKYSGEKKISFDIAKAKNTAKLRTYSKTVKAKSLAKKKLNITPFKLISAVGKVSFKRLSGSARLSVAKDGKVTVKKGTKKGSYNVRIKVRAEGNKNYKAFSETAVITVKVG